MSIDFKEMGDPDAGKMPGFMFGFGVATAFGVTIAYLGIENLCLYAKRKLTARSKPTCVDPVGLQLLDNGVTRRGIVLDRSPRRIQ